MCVNCKENTVTPQNEMLAKAFRAKFESQEGMDIKTFLESIPGSANYKVEKHDGFSVHSVQVMRSATDIILVESNGNDFLITDLT